MEITQLEKVTELNKERSELIELRNLCKGNLDFTSPLIRLVSREAIQAAIYHATHERLVALDNELANLGVRVQDRHIARAGDAVAWQRESDMYKGAWLRELGGVSKLINKSHFIDALVLTTRAMKERSELFEPIAKTFSSLFDAIQSIDMTTSDQIDIDNLNVALKKSKEVIKQIEKLLEDQKR